MICIQEVNHSYPPIYCCIAIVKLKECNSNIYNNQNMIAAL